MLFSASRRIAFTPKWARDILWRRARAVPSLDLRFADNKSLVDATTGQNLVTFTRASSGTYVDSQGVIRTATTNEARFDHSPTTGESLGLLVEESRTNNVLQSEDFATTWTASNLTVTTNSVVAPDGTTTADTISPPTDGLTVTRFLRQNPVLTTQQAYTFSVFVKVGTATTNGIALYVSDNTATNNFRSNFNLFSLTTSAAGSGWATPTATIIPYPNGWYRCILSGVTSTTHGSLRAQIYLNAFGTVADSYGSMHIWGAQLEAGSFPTSYIPTTTATVTRSADVASITGSNFGVSRTNLLLQSEDFGTTWLTNNYVITANAIASPSGTTTADKLARDTTNITVQVTQNVTCVANTAYTFSCFVKAAEWSKVGLREGSATGNYVTFDLSTATVVSTSGATGTITPFPNGWYRVTMQMTTGVAQTTYGSRIIPLPDTYTSGNPLFSFAGDGTSGIYLWGAQLETGSTATAYIPTTTAAVTVFESPWYRQDEGTVFSEFSAAAYSTASYAISDGTNSNRILVDRGSTGTRYVITNAGVAQSGGAQTPYTLNSFVKTSLGYALDNCNLAVGGVLQTLDTSATISSTVDRLLLGVNAGGSGYGNGPIKRFTFWPRRLSDPTLQGITQQ